MQDDHLDKETSISAELTETGVKATAKSRTMASLDRLLGSVADIGSAWFESFSTRLRAKSDGERRLIDAVANHGVARLESDSDFANRVFENQFRKFAQQQLNKDAVAAEAIEDLRQKPPTEEEAVNGPPTLSEEFMSRFETYAEGASSEDLRQRWGRILAGEIRKPGTFNPRVLRATDELDAEAAILFESLMEYRIGEVLLECIMPKLEFDQLLLLISNGLIVDPGATGHWKKFDEGFFNGEDVWATSFGKILVTYPKSATIRETKSILKEADGRPSFGIYLLSDVGRALSSILSSNETKVTAQFENRLSWSLENAHAEARREIGPNRYTPARLQWYY